MMLKWHADAVRGPSDGDPGMSVKNRTHRGILVVLAPPVGFYLALSTKTTRACPPTVATRHLMYARPSAAM